MSIKADKSAVIGINLKEEDRQEAGVSVGASGEWRGGVGLYGRPRGGSVPLDVSRSTRHAGDHKGSPFRSTPPSPLRTVMSFSYVDAYQGR